MPQTTFSVRMDAEIKEQLDDFCRQVGMTTSTAFNLFARAVLREKRLPFEVTTETDPFYSPSNLAVLHRSIQEAEEGRVVSKTLDELKAMER